MRFDAIEAISVGALEGETLELAPGLNVIHGVNEAGKSTWHGALIAGWLGLRRGKGAQRTEDRAFVTRHEPWSGRPLIAAVQLTTDAGRRYRFRHNLTDLADHEVTDGTGRILTGDWEQGGTADGARILGLTRDVVRATLVVSQADVLSITAAAEGLQTDLQRAAAAADRSGGTTATALKKLEGFRREQVGTSRVNAVKPLRRAMDGVADAKQHLSRAQQEHDTYLRTVEERDAASARIRELSRQRATLQRSLRAGELLRLRTELGELEELDAVIEDGKDLARPASEDAISVAEQIRSRFADRPPAVEDDSPTRIRELEAELAGLPEMPTGDVRVHPSVQDAWDALRVRRERLTSHQERQPQVPDTPELGEITPDELERHAATFETPLPDVDPQLEERLGALESATRDASRNPTIALGAAVVIAVLVAVVGLVTAQPIIIGVALAAAAAAGVGAVLALRRAGDRASSTRELEQLRLHKAAQLAERRTVEARQAGARQTLAAAGLDIRAADELRRLADQARAADRARRELEQWEMDRSRAAGLVEEATEQLRHALLAREEQVADEPDAAYAAYRARCDARDEQARKAGQRSALGSSLASVRELSEQRRRQREDRQDSERALLELAQSLGFQGDHPDDADRFLEAWLADQRLLRKRTSEVENARTKLTARLGDRTLDQLRDQVGRLAAETGTAAAAKDPDASRRQLADVDTERRQQEARRDELNGQLRELARNATPVPDAEEALAQAQSELDRVQRLKEVLDTTRRFLEDANQRTNQDIAPVLRRAVAEHLPLVTRNRYSDVQVNPSTLEVTVLTDGGRFRPATALSHGTAEQIYLLLRIGLAQHLVTSDETAPIALDDITVQFDEHRTVRVLDLCLQLAEQRQILLFSQEREVLEWAQAKLSGPEHRLHELADPAQVVQ